MVDITPILVAALYALVPTLAIFLVNFGFRKLTPELVKYLGEKNALTLQARVDEVLKAAIGFAVSKGAGKIQAMGGVDVDTKNWLVEIALNYAVKHAPDLMEQAGNAEEKILARFDTHPAVQGLMASMQQPEVPVQPVAVVTSS